MKWNFKKILVALAVVAGLAQPAFAGYDYEKGDPPSAGSQKQDIEHQREQQRVFLDSLKGKTFWIVPNRNAAARVHFFDDLQDIEETLSSADSQGAFHPDATTSFVVDKIHSWIIGKNDTKSDRYFAKITFADGRVGYMDAKETFGYGEKGPKLDPEYRSGLTDRYAEYVFSKEPLAKVGSKKVVRSPQASALGSKKGGVRIGMSEGDVLASSWGRPQHVNKTTTAGGTREQWVYGIGNYLYFEQGVLTAVQN